MPPRSKPASAEPARKSTRIVTSSSAKIEEKAADKAKVKQTSSDSNEPPPAKKAKVDGSARQENISSGTEDSEEATMKALTDVTLKDENGESIALSTICSKGGVVIFSYPKANTPGCTNQACGYRDMYKEFTQMGFQVYGLSQDSPKSQLSWKTKHHFPYSLLSDPSRSLLKQLGATEAKKRCHWVLEKGTMKILQSRIGVKPAEDPTNALTFIKGL